MITRAAYRELTVYGPFKRTMSTTQTAENMRAIIRSGELWGKVPRQGAFLAVQAHHGELSPGEQGFEFFAAAPPDGTFGPPRWREREDGAVWVTDDTARMKIYVSRVIMDF